VPKWGSEKLVTRRRENSTNFCCYLFRSIRGRHVWGNILSLQTSFLGK